MNSYGKWGLISLGKILLGALAVTLIWAGGFYYAKAEAGELPHEIPPEIMQQLRAQIMQDQAAVAEPPRVPDVSGHPEHIRPVCLMCHEDIQFMIKASDGVFTDMEMLLHTLFARNISAHQVPGEITLMITPVYGVDTLKDPNDICIISQDNYPGALIEYVYQVTAAGKYIQHECLQLRPAAWRR